MKRSSRSLFLINCYPSHLFFHNLQYFRFDLVIVSLYLLLHNIVSVLIKKPVYYRYLLVPSFFVRHRFAVHYYSGVKNLPVDFFSEIIRRIICRYSFWSLAVFISINEICSLR